MGKETLASKAMAIEEIALTIGLSASVFYMRKRASVTLHVVKSASADGRRSAVPCHQEWKVFPANEATLSSDVGNDHDVSD